MFEKWYEANRKFRFFSQSAMFLIAIFAVLSFGYTLKAIHYNPEALDFMRRQILVSISFHILIAFLFSLRFILLFFNSRKSFVASQIIWMFCILSIIAYHLATRFALYGALNPVESTPDFGFDNYPILFLHAQNSFVVLIFSYVFISLSRQIITLISTYLKFK